MVKMTIPPFKALPRNPCIWIEKAIGCYGEECNRVWLDEHGELVELVPHYHLKEGEPGAATICYAIGDNLPPQDPYAPAHASY